MNREIIHVDMDAFYASVEQRDFPEYRGKPVVIGADPKGGKGRGVVSAASYEARRYGIQSAQPISTAYRLCPSAIYLPVRGERYSEVSHAIMEIFNTFTPLVESISLDEAFLDMTGCGRLLGSVESVGKMIKEKILREEGLTASVGIGPNKLIAKIASERQKPNGFVVVKSDEVEGFLAPLPVRCMWGIGKKTEERLNSLKIKTIGEMARFSKKDLETLFGNQGYSLWRYAHGIDDSPVLPWRPAKSISNEITFETDQDDESLLLETMQALSEKVAYRMRCEGLLGRTVMIKVRTADFETQIRHGTIGTPINLGEILFSEVRRLYATVSLHGAVRLLGVGMSSLQSTEEDQLDLFHDSRRGAIANAVDGLKQKFGEDIIVRGGILKKTKKGSRKALKT